MPRARQQPEPLGPERTSWDGASAGSLAHALTPPAADCAETSVIGPSPRPPRRMPAGSALGLTVTARSVYRHPVAKVFAAALRTRLELEPMLHERLHTALQEALMNAMLHGNLGLGSGLRNDLPALAASAKLIEARFATDAIACSMIRIEATWSGERLRVSVRDSGRGFRRTQLPSPEQRLAAGQVGSGRGLMILEMLCDHVGFNRAGTAITLGFSLPGTPP